MNMHDDKAFGVPVCFSFCVWLLFLDAMYVVLILHAK